MKRKYPAHTAFEYNCFDCWGVDCSLRERQIIEIFPFEAIWSLGLLNSFPIVKPCEVRSYKKKKPSSMVRDVALETALKPLMGFVECFESRLGLKQVYSSRRLMVCVCAGMGGARDGWAVAEATGSGRRWWLAFGDRC